MTSLGVTPPGESTPISLGRSDAGRGGVCKFSPPRQPSEPPEIEVDRGEFNSGLRAKTPAEKKAIAAAAVQIRGEFRWVAGQGGNQGHVRREGLLPVLDAGFRLDDMTPRAAVRVILSDPTTRRVFGRRRAAS